MKNEVDLVGRRFGMLVVLERTRYRRTTGKLRYMARCQCDCGHITETDVGSLMRGATTSCGCRRDQYAKVRGSNSPQFTGYQQITGHDWSQFQRRARRRGLVFNITIQYAWMLYERQGGRCALTGVPLEFGAWHKRPTASLDRLDNEQGYVEGNIQWVHKSVNIMRNIYSLEHFIEACLFVARQQGWRPPEGAAELPTNLRPEPRLHRR
jgi:hypothetical protein